MDTQLLIPVVVGATFALGTFLPAAAVLAAAWAFARAQDGSATPPWFLTAPSFLALSILASAELTARASPDWKSLLRELGPAPNLVVAALTGAGLAGVLQESAPLWGVVAASTAYFSRNLRNLRPIGRPRARGL